MSAAEWDEGKNALWASQDDGVSNVSQHTNCSSSHRYFKLKGATDTSAQQKKKLSSKEGVDLDYLNVEDLDQEGPGPVDFAG